MPKRRLKLNLHLKKTVEYRLIRNRKGQLGYRVGDDGSVWSRMTTGRTPKIGDKWFRLKQCTMKKGYLFVNIGRGNPQYVHHLVLEVFVGPRPPGQEGRHKDGIKAHCWLGNLEYGTPKQNGEDRVKHGTANGPTTPMSRDEHPHTKMSSKRAAELVRRRAAGESWQQLSADFTEVKPETLANIVRSELRKHGKIASSAGSKAGQDSPS